MHQVALPNRYQPPTYLLNRFFFFVEESEKKFLEPSFLGRSARQVNWVYSGPRPIPHPSFMEICVKTEPPRQRKHRGKQQILSVEKLEPETVCCQIKGLYTDSHLNFHKVKGQRFLFFFFKGREAEVKMSSLLIPALLESGEPCSLVVTEVKQPGDPEVNVLNFLKN